ncbi:MAG: hypothetical protein ABI156_01410 [Caldimonas sp.]
MVALSGCATYHAQPIDPSAVAHAFETRSLDSGDLQRYVALHPDRGGDPVGRVFWDLETLTLAEYYFNPGLDAARARSATSEAARVGILGVVPGGLHGRDAIRGRASHTQPLVQSATLARRRGGSRNTSRARHTEK